MTNATQKLVQGSQSTARSFGVQGQQWLTESQVFEDEILPGTESADHPAEDMPDRHDHGKNLSEPSEASFSPSHSSCGCATFWRGTPIKSAIADLLYASCVLKRSRAGAVAYDTSYVG
jgi:hypothetical protein